jgi:hypothetical protein
MQTWKKLAPLTLLLTLPSCATLDFLAGSSEESVYPSERQAFDSPGRPWTSDWRAPAMERAPSPRDRDKIRTSYSSSDRQDQEYDQETPESRSGIAMGMSRSEVRRIWGSPVEVETAGQPSDGNFRWIYPLSTFRSIGDTRIVTFENGEVAGWETVRPD